MSSDQSLITFRSINNFVTELATLYSKNIRPLKLYKRLLDQTKIIHEHAIQKHIDAFQTFCVSNRDKIMEKNKDLVTTNITYSQNVFINMKDVFAVADTENTAIIWKHLLCISAMVDPAGNAKKILKENMEKNKGGESKFLTDIIDKVEQHVDPKAKPMEAVASIMKSGLITDLIANMQNGVESGDLNINNLLSSVQSMMTNLKQNTPDSEDSNEAMPDMTQMFGMMSSMMNNMKDTMGTPVVKDVTDS